MKKLLTLALAAIMCAGSAKALDYVPEQASRSKASLE